jgi:hypothetical protein
MEGVETRAVHLRPKTIHLTRRQDLYKYRAVRLRTLDNGVQGFKTELIEGQWRPFGPAEGPEGRFFWLHVSELNRNGAIESKGGEYGEVSIRRRTSVDLRSR